MHLLACISHHGYGHLAQAAPVLNRLLEHRPDIDLSVLSGLPRPRLEARIRAPFRHLHRAADCGLIMRDALRVDTEASLDAYGQFHTRWEARVERAARWLVRRGVTAVFSDVAYLPLAAASQAGLPSMAMCSLNWADIFAHYFHPEAPGILPQASTWLSQMRSAYASATCFLRPTPAMAMPDLPNTRAIGPIVTPGARQIEPLRLRLGLENGQRLVLLGLGGISYRPTMEGWPERPDLAYMVPDEWRPTRPDMRTFSASRLAFIDLLASCDALVTKPGYGSFTEAAVHGLPVVYLPRPDWPEGPVLESWLHQHTRAACMQEEHLAAGHLPATLATLWDTPPPPRPAATGDTEAARLLSGLLA